MRRRKRNIYFDRKSLGFKLGKKPLTREQKRKQAAIRKQERAHAKIAEREGRKQARKKASGQFQQIRREAQKEAKARALVERDRELWQELYGKQNPAREFPGSLTDAERLALRKLIKRSAMATKKRRRKKNKSRKGKMPAGLAAYWRKKRAKKAKRKNPKKRPRAKVRRLRRRKTVRRRARNYRRPARKVRRRRVRRAKRNPVRRRTRIIKAPYGLSGKGLRTWARAKGRELGVPARILGQFRR